MKMRHLVALIVLVCAPLLFSHPALAQWTSGGPYGGNVRVLAINPTTPAMLYAGTDGGGVFKSTDSGGTWAAANTGLTGPPVAALAINPATPATLYAGTAGGGVFKSTDSGSTWVAANTGLTDLYADYVNALAINPTTPATLYAGTSGGVFKSTDSGGTWAAANTGLTNVNVWALAINPTTPATLYAGTYAGGVFKSTDSGGTWAAVNAGLTDLTVFALAINPTTPATLYAGTSYGAGGVFKSTDSGGTWAAVNTGLTNLNVNALAINPTAPATLYAGTDGGVVFKSTDSGGTWATANAGLTDLYVNALAINPTSSATLYAGTNGGGVFKSIDSGNTWAAANTGLTLNVNALAINPTTPATLYAGTNGSGVFKSTDSGGTWAAANTGLTTPYVFALAINPTTPATLYAGTWYGGVFKSIDSGGTWAAANTGLTNFQEVYALAINPTTPATLYAGTDVGVFKSIDSGGTWAAANTGLTNLDVYALAINPTTPSTLFAGVMFGSGSGVYKSTDSGGTWAAANTGLTGPQVVALAINPTTPSTLYAGTYFTGVFKSTDSGGTWAAANTGLTASHVQALAINPTTPATLYAGTYSGGVFKSTNAGGTWAAANAGLTNLNVYALALDPTGATTLYAGLWYGSVWQLTAGGSSTAPAITTQPSNQAVAAGANATFTVAASGTPAPTLQWQMSANGGSTFTDLTNAGPYSGVTTATFTISAAPSSFSGRQFRCVATNSAGSATSTPATLTVTVGAGGPFSQQGPKLVGTGAVGNAGQGTSVSLSADGNTAIVGGYLDNSNAGAAWVWTRSGGVWTQQGTKLVGSGAIGNPQQGVSASLSADGNTAIVGGPFDNGSAGAAWVWTRSGGVWTQQGPKLVGSGAVGAALQGQSVSLSADGNTAIVGGYGDSGYAGAAWVWTRGGGVWTQQGTKLVGSGAVGTLPRQGASVSLSGDGNTAIVGGIGGNGVDGAAWVWTRSGGVWTQQGTKLVGSGAVGAALQGQSVSLSGDGNTAIVGGDGDDNYAGAAWIWTRSGGVWTQQGTKLVGSGAVAGVIAVRQGASVSLSGDGNTAIVGGYGDSDNNYAGAAWVWTRSGGVWTQQGTKLVGSGNVSQAMQGASVSLSGDGNTAIVGGPYDNSTVGAAWVFAIPALTTLPSSPTPLSPGGSTEGQTISTLTPTLQWTPGDGATSYAITISARPYGSNSVVYSNAFAFGTSLTLPSGVLVNGGRYRWEMTAINSAGTSVVSTSLYFQVVLAGILPLPAPPVALAPGSGLGSGPALDTSTPIFRWTASTGASTYGLRISRSPFGPSDVIFSNLAIADISFTLPGTVLSSGTQYRWNVTAINTGGESAPSNSMYFAVRASPSALPAAPTGITATWVNGHVSLGWADMSTNETGFKIERRDGSGTYGQIATTGQNTNFYTDTVAATTIDHCYRVRATNGAGDSAYSNEFCLAHLGSATASQHLQFSSAAYTSAAAEALSYVTITRTGGSTGTVGVTVLVSQGTATAGVAGSFGGDYFSFGPVAISFAPGQTSQTVAVLKVLLQRADDCTVNVALTASTGDATLGSPRTAVMTIPGTGTGSAPGKISKQDPVCLQDPVHCAGGGLLPSGFPDQNKLSQLARVDGAAADGVTLLVLSVPSSSPVTFSLSLPLAYPRYGKLMHLDGSLPGSAVTVTPIGSTAYALYLAPLNLAEEMLLGVYAKNEAGSVIATTDIDLRFPPVVLVPGLWSDYSSLANMNEYLWSTRGYPVVLTANYDENASDTFNPFGQSIPILKVVNAIGDALELLRSRRIAASQVDVVGHSMGGLVARARERDPRLPFRRRENRNLGELHKLITIGTPHKGSPLADWLWAHKDCLGAKTLAALINHPLGQAIYDLQTTSPTLSLLNGTTTPTYAIYGEKPLLTTETEKFLDDVIHWVDLGKTTISTMMGTDGDDVIVPVPSQQGGLAAGTTAGPVNGVIHSAVVDGDSGITETEAREVFEKVSEMLTASRDPWFGLIPPFQPKGGASASAPCFGISAPRSGREITSGVGALSPALGTVVRPGESIQIGFSVAANSTSALFSVGGKMFVVTGSSGSFSATYQLSPNVTGRINISASTRDLGIDDISATTYVVALPSTPPVALISFPGSISFATQGLTTTLRVSGTYGGGATADLTSSASGTTYSTLSGTNSVITISTEGIVQAVANGEDTIIIQNGGQTASVTAMVTITNQRPTLAALADTVVVAGQTLTIPLTASDPDGNNLQLSGTGLPSFVTLVDNHDGTGVLSVRPIEIDVGSYPIYISVVDDGNPALGLSQSFQLTVTVGTVLSCYTFSTGVISVGMGSVTVNTASNCTAGYTASTGISLTANPLAGYSFTGWSGSGGTFSSTSSNPTTFTITGNASVTATFGALPGTPVVTGVLPRVGPVSGGTPVTVTGTGFQPGATISIGGAAAGSVSFVNSTTLIATTPARPVGPADIAVTNPGGAASLVLPNGFLYTTSGGAPRFYTIVPCRILDTRNPNGPFGGPLLAAGSVRSFSIPGGSCSIPADAAAVVLNVTIADATDPGTLTIFPGSGSIPGTNTISFVPGKNRANNVVLGLVGGVLTVKNFQSTGSINLIVDVNGYFK
jgi:photosystem II stability/assembly factor-like uncharacterized protein